MSQSLAAQEVKILARVRRLADLKVVPRSQLQKTFDTRARVLGSLPFVAVRQQQHQAGEQSPLVFPGADELINHCL